MLCNLIDPLKKSKNKNNHEEYDDEVSHICNNVAEHLQLDSHARKLPQLPNSPNAYQAYPNDDHQLAHVVAVHAHFSLRINNSKQINYNHDVAQNIKYLSQISPSIMRISQHLNNLNKGQDQIKN